MPEQDPGRGGALLVLHLRGGRTAGLPRPERRRSPAGPGALSGRGAQPGGRSVTTGRPRGGGPRAVRGRSGGRSGPGRGESGARRGQVGGVPAAFSGPVRARAVPNGPAAAPPGLPRTPPRPLRGPSEARTNPANALMGTLSPKHSRAPAALSAGARMRRYAPCPQKFLRQCPNRPPPRHRTGLRRPRPGPVRAPGAGNGWPEVIANLSVLTTFETFVRAKLV